MLPTPKQLNDNDENEELEAIRDLQREVSGAQRAIAVSSSMANAANIHLLAGEGDPFDDSGDNPFTGTAILYPAFVDANGNWHIIGMNAGTLQFGLSATDGKAYAGGGAVVLGAEGIAVKLSQVSDTQLNSYSLVDASGVLHSYLSGREDANDNQMIAKIFPVTGKTSAYYLITNSPAGSPSIITFTTEVDGVDKAVVRIDEGNIQLNYGTKDINTYINGDTATVIAVDAGTDSATINKLSTTGTTTINSTSEDFDTVINGDTTAVITVDASADGATVNNLTVTGTAGNVLSGTYTPTLTIVTNIDVGGATAYVCQYMRVGSVVTVSGRVAINATAAGAVLLRMSLPVASNFANETNCGGVAQSPAVNQPLAIYADDANDVAYFNGIVTSTANQSYYFSFTYRII